MLYLLPVVMALASCFSYRALYWAFGFDFGVAVMHEALMAGATSGVAMVLCHVAIKND